MLQIKTEFIDHKTGLNRKSFSSSGALSSFPEPAAGVKGAHGDRIAQLGLEPDTSEHLTFGKPDILDP